MNIIRLLDKNIKKLLLILLLFSIVTVSIPTLGSFLNFLNTTYTINQPDRTIKHNFNEQQKQEIKRKTNPNISIQNKHNSTIKNRYITDKDNPWKKENLIISYKNKPSDIDVNTVFEQVVTYWNNNIHYSPYKIQLKYIENTKQTPDIQIIFKNFSKQNPCRSNNNPNIYGCAPIIEKNSKINKPVKAYISKNEKEKITIFIIKHELGHILGIKHGEQPTEIMEHQYTIYEILK